MTVLITLNSAGSDSGPFDLYTDLNGYTAPFLTGVSKATLLSGYSADVPDYTTIVRVMSKGVCTNSIDIVLQTTSTTTTTTTGIPELPCNTSISSGGEGITNYDVNLESAGGIFTIAFHAQTVPDKLEILHNNVKVATSSMTSPNEGPFDDVYGDVAVPSGSQANATTQFIGSSKGAIPTRQTEFTNETESIVTLPAGFHQLVWWVYTPADFASANTVTVRITGPGGTAWSMQRLCEPE